MIGGEWQLYDDGGWREALPSLRVWQGWQRVLAAAF